MVGATGLPPRAEVLERGGEPVAPASVRRWLELVAGAVEEEKVLRMTYWVPARNELTLRDLSPYGFAYRRGEWILVGHCHRRKGVRLFYLRRVRSLKPAPAGKSTEPFVPMPGGFEISAWSRQEPWDYLVHDRREAVVRFTGSLAKIAATLIPGAKLTAAPDNARLARFVIRNTDGLVRQCLAWGVEAELLEPAEAREAALAVVQAIAAPTGSAP